jgi:hypothetical protein
LQTTWRQGTPYNNMTPIDGNGNHAAAGCYPVAIAQIMKYHRHPVRGNGQSEPYTSSRLGIEIPSVDFNVVYDWDNMLNSYHSDGRDSEQQRNAVSTLMYHIGVSMKAAYGIGSTGGTSGNAMRTLVAFGYDKSIQKYQRSYYDDATWERMLKSQLDAGLPVIYGGQGHAQIVDGYDNQGRFHRNCGWGGKHDGWYSINELNQHSGEAYDNAVEEEYGDMIFIKPDEGGVPNYKMALNIFTASKTTVSQNESFVVTARLANRAAVLHENLSVFPGGHVGVALVDNGGIIKVIGISSFSSLNPESYRTPTIDCYIPETINPGQYQLKIVIRPTGEEWKFVDLSAIREGIPNVIPFTLTAGEANGGGYGLGLTNFTTSKNIVSQNETFTVNYQFKNMGLERSLDGEAGVALVNNNGNIVTVIETRSAGALNAGSTRSNRELNCTVPNTVPPGQYHLRIVFRPTGGEWRIATLSNDGIPTSIDFEVQ